MKYKIVKESEVVLPERGTKNWQRLEDRIRQSMTEEDAAIVLGSNEAMAVWVYWEVQFDGEIVEPFDSMIHGPYDPAKWVSKVMASSYTVDEEVTKIEEDDS